jgi:hypothetical protein
MADREFSEEQRQAGAREGTALPDGSYYMPDCDAVERARQAYGRAPDSHRAELAALINKRNTDLKCGQPRFTPSE